MQKNLKLISLAKRIHNKISKNMKPTKQLTKYDVPTIYSFLEDVFTTTVSKLFTAVFVVLTVFLTVLPPPIPHKILV